MKLYNHVAYKMCQHEMDMAQHIPAGGNWKNIPEEITDTSLDLHARETISSIWEIMNYSKACIFQHFFTEFI